MTSKTIKVAVVVAALAVAGYWYWSPFLAVRQLQTAAQKQDADAFNERVDYPRLRESLKGQFSALMAREMGKSTDDSNPFSALGSMLGLAMVNQFVEAMVRPEVVMQAMRSGKLSPADKSQADTAAPPAPTTAKAADSDKPKWTYERKGVDKLIAYAVDPKAPDEASGRVVGLVFERSGFATWKLTGFRLPALNKQ
ncbi:MAG: DUF2939 domain-containing protein [Gemmatimonadaceae bacterium]